MVIRLGPHGARGTVVPRTTLENLSIALVPRTNLAKADIPPTVNLCTTYSDL
jgi:hypothetical protein